MVTAGLSISDHPYQCIKLKKQTSKLFFLGNPSKQNKPLLILLINTIDPPLLQYSSLLLDGASDSLTFFQETEQLEIRGKHRQQMISLLFLITCSSSASHSFIRLMASTSLFAGNSPTSTWFVWHLKTKKLLKKFCANTYSREFE